MPSRKYSLEKGEPQRLEVSWKSFWKDIEIRLDGAEVFTIANKKELEEGREFSLIDGSKLKIQLVKTAIFFPELRIFRDDRPLPGSDSDSDQQVKVAYQVIFIIAGLNIFLGLVLTSAEIIAEAVVFLFLGFFVKKKSKYALVIAIGLFSLAIIMRALEGILISIPVSILFLIPMVRGLKAIKCLDQQELQNSTDKWYNEGVDLGEHGRYDEAIEAYKKAIKIRSEHGDALFNLSTIYSIKGEKQKALENLEKAIKIDISNKEQAAQDKDFVNLKNDEDFRKLIEYEIPIDEKVIKKEEKSSSAIFHKFTITEQPQEVQKKNIKSSQKIDVHALSERQELIKLCKQYWIGVDHYAAGGSSPNNDQIKNEIRAIGERLGEEGGKALMRKMGESLEDPRWRSIVDSCWDGVHGWMY